MELLDFLLNLPQPLPTDGTESDLRAVVIDPILAGLGWGARDIKREPYAGWSDDKGFIDYLLLIDSKPMMVLEAKKTGRTFSIPQQLSKQRVTTFRKLRATGSKDLQEALEQCLRYAQHTGALYACATNGSDWVIFKPNHPFRSLPDALTLIFQGTDQITKRLDQFVDVLSPLGIQQGKCEKALLGREIQVPTFSKRLQDAFPYRGEPSWEEEEYSNVLDQILKHYVIELTSEDDFEECYQPVKGNRATGETLQALVTGRIHAVKEPTPQTAMDFGTNLVATPAFPSVASGRTVVLHGEVGVGKTSFLRYTEIVLRNQGVLNDAVWARIDLLPFIDRRFASDEVRSMLELICQKIQERVSEATDKMNGRYDPDVWDHLRDIYNSEVRRFQKARYPSATDADLEFLAEARKYVWDLKEKDPQDHLIRVIRWLTINCKLPVILVLDNSDQLGLDFQEFLYKLAETLQERTSAVVIIVVRSVALESHSIREHALASVREQFLVQKAPLPLVLIKRFEKILRQLPNAYTGSIAKVAKDRIEVLMDTLRYEAHLGSQVFQVVECCGGGTLRDGLRAVSAIFRSSPKAMDNLVVEHAANGRARLTLAQTVRALNRDDIGSSESTKLLPNVFNVDGQVLMPYSLGVREMQQIRAKAALSHCTVSGLLNDFSLAGVDRTIAERTLLRLRADRFISVSHMLPELRETDAIVLTRLGEVLLDILLAEESYFGRVAFSTYIYDKDVYYNMRSAWTSTEDYHHKFKVLTRQFTQLVSEDDALLRRRIETSLLEPVVSAALPGLLGGS